MTRTKILITLFLFSLLNSACASKTTQSLDAPSPQQTIVYVDNNNFSDANIYLITADGRRVKLGFAIGKRFTKLKVPKHVNAFYSEMYFYIDFIAASGFRTYKFYANLGDEIMLQIGAIPEFTFITIR